MTDSERLTKMINGIHEAMGDSYRQGHRDASEEILGEAIHALQLKGNQDVAIAILKNLIR
jgi:hypothetical protein